jgi:hypothetical protein
MKAAIAEFGECPPDGSPGFPEGVRVVTRANWEKQFVAYSVASGTKPESAGRAFRRVADGLVEKGFAFQTGQWVWPADTRT